MILKLSKLRFTCGCIDKVRKREGKDYSCDFVDIESQSLFLTVYPGELCLRY